MAILQSSNADRLVDADPYGLFTLWIEYQRSHPPQGEENVASNNQDSVEAFLTEAISTLSGVEAIFIRKDADFLRIWVVINEPNLEVEDRVYTKYVEQLRRMPELLTDLCITFRMGRPVKDMASEGSRLLYKA